jgi:hypothetical protein
MDHPLSPSPVPFPSPPLSPADRDLECLAGIEDDPAYRSGGFLASALSRTDEHDPLLLKSKLQSEEHMTDLRKRKKGKTLGSFYSSVFSPLQLSLGKQRRCKRSRPLFRIAAVKMTRSRACSSLWINISRRRRRRRTTTVSQCVFLSR